MYIGGSAISGYAPWATWLEILLVIGGATAGVMFAVWLSRYRKRNIANNQS